MMNPEKFQHQVSHLIRFNQFREMARQAVENEQEVQREEDGLYLSNLMLLPVSSLSVFESPQWNFNEDAEAQNVSVNCRGSSLVIDWSLYDDVPKFVITELKCLMYLYKLNPKSFMTKDKTRSHIKLNTLVKVTKDGMNFINHLFKQINANFGKEYIHDELYSLTELNQGMFEEAAADYPFTYGSDLKTFLDNLRHPYAKNIFSELIDLKNVTALNWANLPKKGVYNDKVIPNNDFEKLVYNSSLIVNDFILAMGDTPVDKIATKHLKRKEHTVKLFSDYGFDEELFAIYAAYRLKQAGYNNEFIIQNVSAIENNSYRSHYKKSEIIPSRDTIHNSFVKKTGNVMSDMKQAVDIVRYAASFLVAQFTGMRPSELSDIPIDCITVENGCELIKSQLTKGKENKLKGLFDEKWIAIPTILDSVKAIQCLNCFTLSDRLFSSVRTKKPDEVKQPLLASSFKHQIDLLIAHIFGKEKVYELGFYAYMTRHTLAYQLFRADVGLPFISYQLKHLVTDTERYTSKGKHSDVTLDYGYIGDELAKGTRGLRKRAEIESVKVIMDPDGTYAGPRGQEHSDMLRNLFEGYMAEGYTKEEVLEAMAEQGVALVNMGQGFCYGGRSEDFDESLPCIGSLRCNPIRCKNAIVTKANAPKWREVYNENLANLDKPEYVENRPQILEVINEAESVLNYLGEPLVI